MTKAIATLVIVLFGLALFPSTECSRGLPHKPIQKRCKNSDIQIRQAVGSPAPSGIPTYVVEIGNMNLNGCYISRIHVACPSFSSDSVIDPNIFKVLSPGSCLLNGGRPMAAGSMLYFEYFTTRMTPLSVSSVTCTC